MAENHIEEKLEELLSIFHQNIEVERAQREDMQVLDEHLQRVGRRLLVTTILVYLLFAALCVTGAYLWIDLARRNSQRELTRGRRATRNVKAALATLRKTVETQKNESRLRSERIARYLETFLAGEEKGLLKQHDELISGTLTPLERVVVLYVHREIRQKAGFETYTEGVALYNQAMVSRRKKPEKFKEAVEKLELALKYDNSGKHVPSLHYYLGLTYYRLSHYRLATKHLEYVSRSSRGAEMMDPDGLFRLAHAHDLLKQEAQARRNYELFLKRFPKNQNAGMVKQKLKQLK